MGVHQWLPHVLDTDIILIKNVLHCVLIMPEHVCLYVQTIIGEIPMSDKYRCYRIRRCTGTKNGANHYHHADVLAPTWQQALRAAREGRVQTWRWIDKFDTSDEDYEEYEYLYKVGIEEFRVYPVVPVKTPPTNWNPPPKRSFVSYLANRKRVGAKV